MSQSTNPPVPENQAVIMTTHWRNHYAEITGGTPENALRAFKIPMEDLINLVNMASERADIDSVRAYLALGEATPAGTLDPDKVHIILVPVANTSEAGSDILSVTQPDGTKKSTILDFTNPCPALCDLRSPLYGPVTE